MAFAICTAAVVQGGEFVRKGEVIDQGSRFRGFRVNPVTP